MNRKGFTLIELLVVISIIGLLSSVVLASLSNVKAKARDARRISDLTQIKKAIELYYDTNGFYPRTPSGWDYNQYNYSFDSSWDTFAADLQPYISPLPKDPLNSGGCPPWSSGCYTYAYGNVGRNGSVTNSGGVVQYDLTAQLETPNHPQSCTKRGYKYYFYNADWCGNYSGQIYEASY